MNMRSRPVRPRCADEFGRFQTLAQGPEAFLCLHTHDSGDIFLLGLGPDPASTVAQFAAARRVRWIESPAFCALLDAQTPGWRENLPPHWRELSVREATDAATRASAVDVWLYRQHPRIFPSFWGPLMGTVRANLLDGAAPPRTRAVWLPGDEKSLLHRELTQAFADIGLTVRSLPPPPAAHKDKDAATPLAAVGRLLREERPAFYFSVNLRGLDAAGEVFALLRACGVPVAVWFVDNPWHILSALRLPWWKEAVLLSTDASFLPALREAGACEAHHLPLGFCPEMANAAPPVATATTTGATGGTTAKDAAPASAQSLAAAEGRIVFVGRAAFPAHDAFFAAARVPTGLAAESEALLDAGARPDFHWWTRRLAVRLWPGHQVRAAGLGAEICALGQRVRWLRAAAPCCLDIYGDSAAWREHLPHMPAHRLHDAVDYYAALPAIYAQAAYTLNVTSLLLPAGLTQRHFDVWAAGGFLLSDPTPGLDIFPTELVREMVVPSAAMLPTHVDRLEREPTLRRDLATAWRQCVNAQHAYSHRATNVAHWLRA